MGGIQCCQRPLESAVCTDREDATEARLGESLESLSHNDSVHEAECKNDFHIVEALAKASVDPGAQPAAEDEHPPDMDMATLRPSQDVTVDEQDLSTSRVDKLDHPATNAPGQSDQMRLHDNATTTDVKSRNSPATTARADSGHWPNMQIQCIIVPELEAFREHRMAAVSFAKPSEPTNGWRACGDERTECWVKVDYKRKPWTTKVFMGQSSDVPMVHYGTDGLSGLLPILCELSKWPEWFPFARETACLHIWEDGTELWYLKCKILAFSTDACIVTKVYDHMLDLGYVEIVSTTPAVDAKEVCGVTLPKKPWGCVRAETDKVIIRFTPTSLTDCNVTVEVAGDEQLPVEWVVKHLWSTLAKKLEPLIAAQQDPWRKRGLFNEALEGPHGHTYRSIHSHVVQRMKL